jgi:FtsZ-binding cell division protein ZapB
MGDQYNDLDYEDLEMLSQYIQNQQQIINELIEKNMQLTTEVQVQRLAIKQLESINNTTYKPKKRISAFKQERLGLIKQE